MNRRDFVNSVARRLSEDSQAVSYPDHPLLMRGPDVLSASGNGLRAYFAYMGSGQRPAAAPQQVRQLLARFALPRGTEFVLAVPNVDVRVSDLDVALFDFVEGWPSRGPRWRERLAGGPSPGGVVDELRAFHMQRFSDAWASPPDGPRRSYSDRGVPTSQLRHKRPRRRRDISVDNGRIYVQMREMPSSSAVSLIMSNLIVDAVDLDYPMDLSGLSETARALYGGDAHLALHHAYLPPPQAGRVADPYKPYRAAAFAGLQSEFEGV